MVDGRDCRGASEERDKRVHVRSRTLPTRGNEWLTTRRRVNWMYTTIDQLKEIGAKRM